MILKNYFIILIALVLFWSNGDLQQQFAETLLQSEQETEETIEPERVVDPNKPMIALTFDDGPGKYTMQILDQLEEYDARASFFVLGICVDEYPDEIRRMQELGCEIGNHTTNHKRLTKLDAQGIVTELSETNRRLQNVIGEEASIMRPPYGSINELVEANVSTPIAMWSVDTMDWENKNVEHITNHVLENVEDGDIVLLHDIYEATAQATMQLIPALIDQGYQLVTVSELAQARGVELQAGIKYFEFNKE